MTSEQSGGRVEHFGTTLQRDSVPKRFVHDSARIVFGFGGYDQVDLLKSDRHLKCGKRPDAQRIHAHVRLAAGGIGHHQKIDVAAFFGVIGTASEKVYTCIRAIDERKYVMDFISVSVGNSHSVLEAGLQFFQIVRSGAGIRIFQVVPAGIQGIEGGNLLIDRVGIFVGKAVAPVP